MDAPPRRNRTTGVNYVECEDEDGESIAQFKKRIGKKRLTEQRGFRGDGDDVDFVPSLPHGSRKGLSRLPIRRPSLFLLPTPRPNVRLLSKASSSAWAFPPLRLPSAPPLPNLSTLSIRASSSSFPPSSSSNRLGVCGSREEFPSTPHSSDASLSRLQQQRPRTSIPFPGGGPSISSRQKPRVGFEEGRTIYDASSNPPPGRPVNSSTNSFSSEPNRVAPSCSVDARVVAWISSLSPSDDLQRDGPPRLPPPPPSSRPTLDTYLSSLPPPQPRIRDRHPPPAPQIESSPRLSCEQKGKGRAASTSPPASPPPPKRRPQPRNFYGQPQPQPQSLTLPSSFSPLIPHTERPSSSTLMGRKGNRGKEKPRTGKASNTPASFSSRKEVGDTGEELLRKPRLPSRPPVWSYGRQEMCESLMYWRSFQSSIYQTAGTAYSYLLDGFPSARDVWAEEGRVIVSHGGGNAMESFVPDPSNISGPPTRTFRLREDQAGPNLTALLNSARNRTSIVLLAGSNYSEIPFDIGCGYVVLGWYWISLAWIEPEEPAPGSKLVAGRPYFHRLKLRFDWISSQGEPWWTLVDSSLPATGWDPQEFAFAAQQSRDDQLESAILSTESLKTSTLEEEGGMDVDVDLDTSSPVAPTSRLATSSIPLASSPSPLTNPPANTVYDPNRATSISPLPPSSLSGNDHPTSPFHAEEEICLDEGFSGDQPIFSRPALLTKAARRRLPGEGGVRSLASFNSQEARVVPDEPDEFTTSRPHEKCASCLRVSPVIYEQGPICLNTDCTRFWKMMPVKTRTLANPPKDLSYSSSFFACAKTPERVLRLPFSVVPPSDSLEGELISGSSWRGIVCAECGKASSREKWDFWQCTSCLADEARLKRTPPIVQAGALSRAFAPPPILGDDVFDPSSGISLSVSQQIGSDGVAVALVLRYLLPREAGSVWHVKPYNLKPFDKLFESYQGQEASALFTPLQQHNSVGRLLAQHFTFNAGEDYKFVVDQNRSLSFHQAPQAVRDGLRLITDTVSQVCGVSVNFNEILSVAYKELQQMNWHDDGEIGLGSVVSSLSLGSDAEMMFKAKPIRREKNVSFRGQNKTVFVSSGAVLEGTSLTLRLMHGDFVIMGGEHLQRMYEHCVVPSGLRIAVTAREITELHGK